MNGAKFSMDDYKQTNCVDDIAYVATQMLSSNVTVQMVKNAIESHIHDVDYSRNRTTNPDWYK